MELMSGHFENWLALNCGELKKEYNLPAFVDDMICSGKQREGLKGGGRQVFAGMVEFLEKIA